MSFCLTKEERKIEKYVRNHVQYNGATVTYNPCESEIRIKTVMCDGIYYYYLPGFGCIMNVDRSLGRYCGSN